jgi:protein-disulfide isomerase
MDIHEAPKEHVHFVHNPEKSSTTITIKRDYFFIGLAIALLIIGFAAGYEYHAFKTPDGGTTIPGLVKVTIDSTDPVLGKANAPLTIIEFSDPSCPFCGAAAGFNQEVIQYLQSKNATWTAPEPGIIKDYVATGKAKLVFKYYPGHGTGAEAMKLGLCANEQGKFWEAHDVFFSNQDKMEDVPTLQSLMGNITGMDAAKLTECYNAKKYDNALQEDTDAGTAAGMQGTPSFYVGNDKDGYLAIVGAQSYVTLKQILNSMLA